MTRALRVLGVALHIAWGFGACVLLYPVLRPRARLALRQLWARGVFRILGVRLRAEPLDIPPGSLVVANHVSWLDALAMHALLPVSVVAKADTLAWPLLGRMLARNETIFVERRATRRLLAVNAEIGARLSRGERVVVFPEGTTTDGGPPLAFRPALFQPAVDGRRVVHALALRYCDRDGRRSPVAAYIEQMSLWESLVRIAAADGIRLEVRACGVQRSPARRRDAARGARAAIDARLRAGGAPPAEYPAANPLPRYGR
ncbi:MAG TPA: lysophospholipid acyltransferase family protein [Burkholderiales bacterium]|nr:lysophospholipid acyltransferase family protein [Burkholderiales bacterium]